MLQVSSFLSTTTNQNKIQSKSQNTETERGWEMCFHGNYAVILLSVSVCVCVSLFVMQETSIAYNMTDS